MGDALKPTACICKVIFDIFSETDVNYNHFCTFANFYFFGLDLSKKVRLSRDAAKTLDRTAHTPCI
jgi:hypothetical protein